MKHFLLTCLLLLAAGPLSAGDVVTWGDLSRTVRYECRVMNPTDEAATEITVRLPLPLDSPRQSIHYLHASTRGLRRIYEDVHGQMIAEYSFDRLDGGAWEEVGFVAGVTLRNMRHPGPEGKAHGAAHGATQGTLPVLDAAARARYLAAEKNYSMDSGLMRTTAAGLTRGALNDFEKLARIHDAITERVRYVRDGRWDPALTVLTRGSGSCSEYNYLLSGLCRLAGLPTRCAGGSTCAHRPPPTTDTVFHRWTEVFLDGVGWFPVDCSRDANPIRGKRSHFGRLYTDVLVWCRQAGGDDDTLGWEYRAKTRVAGKNPGIRSSSRTRWFAFHSGKEFTAARAWLAGGAQGAVIPDADLLECAILDWKGAARERRVALIRALAGAGRSESLRRAAFLSGDRAEREALVRELTASPDLAATILEKSGDLYDFRSWYRSHETKLVPADGNRFRLPGGAGGRNGKKPTTCDRASQIWADLAADGAGRLAKDRDVTARRRIAIMPVVDRTLAGLGGQGDLLHEAIKRGVVAALGVELADEALFDRFLAEEGPGRGEYWALANAPERGGPARSSDGSAQSPGVTEPSVVPDLVVVPVCVTERVGKTGKTVRYRLDLKTLVLESCRYVTISARADRVAPERPVPVEGVLVAGGDTVLARWEHDVVARNGFDWPLAGVARFLSAADGALCNLECCVSLRGAPAEKGERCPFFYRARPGMLRCLTVAGMDMVTVANNHGGDYGPQSVSDTLHWCERAGLVCTGIGGDAAAAEEPRFVRIGGVRVALAGMDTTMARFCAGKDRAGTNHVDESEKGLPAFTRKMERLGHRVEGRCDLLVLTLHWGGNWEREPRAAHREMARIAFAHGVDLILGHSAHRLQGIEVIDGKAVVYDMGNLLFDCKLKPEGRDSALFRCALSRTGVHAIEVIPVLALEGRTVAAPVGEARRILANLEDLCRPLGTELLLSEDLEGRPMGLIRLDGTPAAPRRTPESLPEPVTEFIVLPVKGETIAPAVPACSLVDSLPDGVTPLLPAPTPAPGVELLAARVPGRARERGILLLSTWWRVTGPVGRHALIAFRIDPDEGDTPRRGRPWYTRHDGADWTVPLHRLEPGRIVVDLYPARLEGLPAGPCTVHALVIDSSLPEGERILGDPCPIGRVEIVPRKADGR